MLGSKTNREPETEREPEMREALRRSFWMFQGQGTEFEERMVESIRSPGLLLPSIQYEEGNRKYRYELTGLQPLNDFLQQQSLSEQALAELVLQICAMVRCLEQHLLEEQNLAVSDKLALIDAESGRLVLCVVPGRTERFAIGMRQLLQALLCAADETSAEALRLGIALFRLSRNEIFGSRELEALVLSKRKRKEGAGLKPAVSLSEAQTAEGTAASSEKTVPETRAPEKAEIEVPELKAVRLAGQSESGKTELSEIQEDEDTTEESPWLRIGVSLLMLTVAMAVLVLLRGFAAALRFLPVYGLLVFAIILYFLAGAWWRKRMKKLSENHIKNV